MGWQGHLQLNYRRDGARTTAHDRHHGPLRVLQRLYPEGDAICHHVLVHPPGGIVGGDTLELAADLGPGSHAVITTPGATRFYRSAGPLATQQVQAHLADGARLEWLPMETIAYRRCRVENRLQFNLAPGAQMIGWDVLALGLPAAGELFDDGDLLQQIELPGVWLERGRLRGDDRLLLDGPLGLAGRGVLATLWLADGQPLGRERTEALIDAARAVIDAPAQAEAGRSHGLVAGVTAPAESLLLLRALAHRVEPAMALLQRVWAAWRPLHWGLPASPPRIWRT
jgi:urease accessory protein